MTVEQLHDAIGLLPGDLLAETDRLRQAPRPKKTVLWKPVLAMAACLALVLTGWFWWFQPKGSTGGTADYAALQAAPAAGAPENGAAAEEAPVQEEEAAPFRSESMVTNSQPFPDWVSTPRLTGEAGEPAAVLLQSPQDWQDYQTQMGEQFDLTELDSWLSALDESWFESQDLALIRVEQIPAEAQPQITAITQEAGTLTVEIPRYDVSGDGVCWHILVDVEKGSLDSGDQISLVME
ncbi:MAG TPA: hypothetical protein IAC30_01895 [Candidatus Faecousia intestinavium]|nr:hypothetical protein [Candidatus Faecousia intestinavium]